MTALTKPKIFDLPNRLQREYRQPQHEADFVLIDPYHWQDHPNMVRLYDKLPTGLPMAKHKAEQTNRYYPKTQVNDFSHFTPNHKKFHHVIVIDIDPQEQFNFMAWADAGLPPPNIIISNPDKPDSIQYIYLLAFPVRPLNSPSSKKWLDDITFCMRDMVNGDKHFARTRSKNPFSPTHDCYVSGAEPYTLSYLADCCDLDLHEPVLAPNKPVLAPISKSATLVAPKPKKGNIEQPEPTNEPKFNDPKFLDSDYWKHGRNGECFEYIRHIAYANAWRTPQDLTEFLLEQYRLYQKRFDTPLPENEWRDSVKSMVKFCVENFGEGTGTPNGIKSRFNKNQYTHTPQEQRERAYRRWVGYQDKEKQARKLLKQGKKKSEICKILGITKPTLNKWENSMKS